MGLDNSHGQAGRCVQEVVNIWSSELEAGRAAGIAPPSIWASLDPNFRQLLDLALGYEEARRVADGQREFKMLAAEEAEREERARAAFMSAYSRFMDAQGQASDN